jgi:RHS repeat-associated protein
MAGFLAFSAVALTAVNAAQFGADPSPTAPKPSTSAPSSTPSPPTTPLPQKQKDPGQITLYLFGGVEQLVLTTGTGAITGTRFIALPGGGEVVRTGTSAGTSYDFELANQQDTGLLTLDDTCQNPQWRQFTPYGAPRGTAPSSWPDTNGFLGKPTDQNTGLTIIGARAYDPGIGQFLSLDPVLNPDEPADLNGYTYADDNPVTDTDPTGLLICIDGQCGDRQSFGKGHGAGGTGEISPTGGEEPVDGLSGPPAQYIAGLTFPGWYPHLDQIAQAFRTFLPVFDKQWLIAPAQASSPLNQLNALEAMCNDGMQATCGQGLSRTLLGDHLGLGAMTNSIIALPGVAGLIGSFDNDLGDPDTAHAGAENIAAITDDAALDSQLSCGQSFTPSTPVLLANGKTRPIAALRPGDKILATNTHTGKTTPQTVAAVLVHHDADLYDLSINSGHQTAIIHATSNHLFWDLTRHQWVKAGELRYGDRLRGTHGQASATVLAGFAPRQHDGWMWDLTVTDDHDFYIAPTTSGAVLVHNCGDSTAQDGGVARFAVNSSGETTVHLQAGSDSLELTEHAALRLTQRGISLDQAETTLGQEPFPYYYGGGWQSGYYDAASRIFIGSADGNITTVIRGVNQNYINNLMAASP